MICLCFLPFVNCFAFKGSAEWVKSSAEVLLLPSWHCFVAVCLLSPSLPALWSSGLDMLHFRERWWTDIKHRQYSKRGLLSADITVVLRLGLAPARDSVQSTFADHRGLLSADITLVLRLGLAPSERLSAIHVCGFLHFADSPPSGRTH